MALVLSLMVAVANAAAGPRHIYSPFEQARAYLERRLKHELKLPETVSQALSERLTERMKGEGEVKPEDWAEEHHTVYDQEWEQNMTHSTVTSPAISLASGEAHFTLNPIFRIPFPKGDYIMVDQQWDIIDKDGKGVPLTELYNHHWLIGTKSSVDPLEDMCEQDWFWGGGAEFRRLDYKTPSGYGTARISAKGSCGANLHFIRVDGLKTHWDGMNDPKGDTGAAIKNCAECGYAPGRDSGICQKFLDGSFACCFTGSRCPVEDPGNRTKKDYFLKGSFVWTRNMSGVKNLRTHLLDVGGAPHMQKGQLLFGTEWNVDSHLSNYGANTQCNGTVCNSTNSVVIGEQKSLEHGWCSGELIWAYNHMHAGSIEATMFINGKKYCKSTPVIGTDPHNTPKNEKGFVVDISSCVNKRTLNNSVVLKKGDVLTVTSLYDVDPNSTRNAPLPGGKHGGIMNLFFGQMHCDPDTYGEKYVCRQGTCIGVKKNLGFFKKTYKNFASCESDCRPETPVDDVSKVETTSDEVVPRGSEETQMMSKVAEPMIGRVSVKWNDCSDGKAASTLTSLTPSFLRLDGKTAIVGSGTLSRAISKGNFTIKMASGLAGITLFEFSGDVCSRKKEYSLDGLMSLSWEGLSCPLQAGNLTATVGLDVSGLIPPLLASTTTTVYGTDAAGDTLFCMEVIKEGYTAEPDVLI